MNDERKPKMMERTGENQKDGEGERKIGKKKDGKLIGLKTQLK